MSNGPVIFGYRWFSKRLHPERKGQRCRVVRWETRAMIGGGYGASRVAIVAFEDGVEVAAQRGMIKTAQGYRETIATHGIGRTLAARHRPKP